MARWRIGVVCVPARRPNPRCEPRDLAQAAEIEKEKQEGGHRAPASRAEIAPGARTIRHGAFD